MSEPVPSPDDLATFGARLRWIRIARGYKQASKLAHKIGRDPRTIYRYEADTKLPKPATLQALCDELDVDDVWLAHGRGEPFRRSKVSSAPPPGVEAYLRTEAGKGVSVDVARALRSMPYSALGVPNPDLDEVSRVRGMIELCRDAMRRCRDDSNQGGG